MYTRRAFAGLLSAVALSHAAAARQTTSDPANESSCRRNYTATAHISFLAVPIFSRSGVGFGFASAGERVQGNSRTVTLRFLSGSTPERAGGLNRFGFIEENVEQGTRGVTRADYFGLITANKEESFAQAKAALETKEGPETAFVAARAVIKPESARYSVRHMSLPSGFRGSNADALLERIRAEFETPRPGEKEKSENLDGQTLGTFLYSLRQAMQAGGAAYSGRFVYNGKLFKLNAAKKSDAKTGGELRKAGITHCAECVLALNGSIVNETNNEATNFRLWFENGSSDYLPLRFEFKPKPYLKLVFDAEPKAQTEALNREAQD